MSYLIHQLLQASAAAHGWATAVVDGERTITYADLEARSNQLARLLIELGVQHGDRVAVYLDKSLESVVGIYSVMKAGAAYVPIDPKTPVRRAAYIAGDCGVRCVLTGSEMRDIWPELTGDLDPMPSLVVMNDDEVDDGLPRVEILTSRAIDAQRAEVPTVEIIDQDLAYILYTSGSTGAPKGVMLSHRNALTFVKWAVDEYGVTADDRLTQLAPLHFDLSTFDLFGAALAGAAVHLVSHTTAMFPMQVKKFVEDAGITVLYSVPSILTMLVERAQIEPGDLGSLRTILFAGEVFPTKYLSRLMKLLPHVEFANLYGPTETNVCTAYRVPEPPEEDEPPISIGSSIGNVDTFVVGDDGAPVAHGEVGELWVRGGTVMQGYWGDPDRTERTRILNPFPDAPPDPVFKTGDLVREEADGNYTFLGRRDNQIKSRGYRIELGEIEAAINAHPDVVECAVYAVPDELITNRIVAVVSAVDSLRPQALERHCADRIPRYMIPEEFRIRDGLPKTSTGKIDRQALGEEMTT